MINFFLKGIRNYKKIIQFQKLNSFQASEYATVYEYALVPNMQGS